MPADTQPRLGACVIAIARTGETEERVVLGRRGRGGNVGKWVIPGGGVNLGETVRDAAVREFKEETGLDVEVVSEPVDMMEFIGNGAHRVSLVLIGSVCSSLKDMKAGDDISEVRAFEWREIPWVDLSPKVRDVLWRRRPPTVRGNKC